MPIGGRRAGTRWPRSSDPAVAGSTARAVVRRILAHLARPDLVVLTLVPLSVASTSYPSGFEVVEAGVVVLAVIMAARWLVPSVDHGRPTVGWPVLCLTGLAGLLVLSWTMTGYGVAPEMTRSDLLGLLVGLALVAAVSMAPPRPRAVAGVVALTGAGAAAYVLHRGLSANGRLIGLGLNTNYLGALLAVAAAAGVGLVRTGDRVGRAGWLIPTGLCGFALLQTHSRGALIAVATGAVVALVGGWPLRRQLFGIGAATVICAGLFTARSPLRDLVLGDRPAEQLGAYTQIRAEAAWVALDVALRNPFRGIGYGAFPFYATTDPRLGIFLNTHNDYLRLAAEAGAATLLIFLVLLVAGLAAQITGCSVALRAAVAAGAVNLLFANTMSNVVVSSGFWVCLGGLLAIRSRRDRPRHRYDHPVGHLSQHSHEAQEKRPCSTA